MNSRRGPRKPGRPPLYIFDKPEDQLTPAERKKMTAIIKRRNRQNKAYRKRREIRNNNRPNHSQNAQVVPDVSFSAPLPVQHSMSAVVPSPQINPWPHQTPPVIPDFSQNPLELLASASGSNPVSSLSTSHRSSIFAPPNSVDDSAPGVKEEPSASFNEHDHIATHSVMSHANSAALTQSSPSLPMSITSEQPVTLEIDATVPPFDISAVPFSFDKDKQHDDTCISEDLVNYGLPSPDDSSNVSANLKDAMDREAEMIRLTSLKNILFNNYRGTYLAMNPAVKGALRHFVIFPRTFNLQAAVSVAGLQQSPSDLIGMQGILEAMIQNNFIQVVNDRYMLQDGARMFLNEDDTVLEDSMATNAYVVAQKRFVKHYKSQLKELQNEKIHKVGWVREKAMAWYDTERDNVLYSQFLLEGERAKLREFLSAGITVMRYCQSAADRERVLGKALADDETSTEDTYLFFNNPEEDAKTEPDGEQEECDKSHRARLQLALCESYFDQLKTTDAEEPLLEALKLLDQRSPRCLKSKQSGDVDLVLALLLLSNLRLGANRTTDARKLCTIALTKLHSVQLGRSTFGINAMSNLVTIYLRERRLDEAKSVASRLLEVLNTMRYTGMPIYADALGVCGMVSMAEGNYREAERQYVTAVETVGNWESKDWEGVPVQHCLDLDLWLREGLADAIRKQGRVEEADEIQKRAVADRESRGLSQSEIKLEDFPEIDVSQDTERRRELESRQTLRHLY